MAGGLTVVLHNRIAKYLVRSFEIGESNPGFRRFDAVSRYLSLAIMQSEDAGFFQHNGFIPSAIRESLVQDLKERRFARGGSTLSMQLVKNVFLSRRKTIARKLEEILIVWLIEDQRLSPMPWPLYSRVLLAR